MVRKITMIGVALIGVTLAFAGNAWADRDRGDGGHRNDRGGNHYGWGKGHGNLHQGHNRFRGHGLPARHHREKNDYHHHHRPCPLYGGHFHIGMSVADNVFGFAMAVSENR